MNDRDPAPQKGKPVICIGIVAYGGLDHQVAQDYMRMMFHLGRRCPEYDFQLAIKGKSEQFRARNAIVKAAIQNNADYIWMLDDDHIINIEDTRFQTDEYSLPVKLVKHLEDRPEIGVVGALYYQRGGDCYPVIMQEIDDAKPFFLKHEEVSHRMQRVDITGGGCMMIRTSVFDKIDDPWFKPEHEWGTDIQLCKQVREAGYEVWCDTSLQIGHLKTDKELITSESISKTNSRQEYKPLVRYRDDAFEYLGIDDMEQIGNLSANYDMSEFVGYGDDYVGYYGTRGTEQLARQVLYHHFPSMVNAMEVYHMVINKDAALYGVDYGCGSAPVGFELALCGHKMDFIDVDGAGAYEFTKWRAKKHGIDCGWKLKGPYDYVMMLDSLEHLDDWRGHLDKIFASLKPEGAIILDFFQNHDFGNPEHINMEHDAVREYFISNGLSEVNNFIWTKAEVKPKEEKAA